ncbi:MAG: CAP domain-containing protein [bacterium]|nr:CAP domain-containing protein [bacterium]
MISSSLLGGHQKMNAEMKADSHTYFQEQKLRVDQQVNDALAVNFLDSAMRQSQVLWDREVHSLSLSELQTIMLDYINSIRKEHKLAPFQLLDLPLAQEHSKYLSESGEDKELDWNDHFDAKGRSIFDRMMDTKIFFISAGENLSTVPPGVTVRQIVDAWMESTMGHREALLASKYQQIMIGHHPKSNNVVLDFVGFD